MSPAVLGVLPPWPEVQPPVLLIWFWNSVEQAFCDAALHCAALKPPQSTNTLSASSTVSGPQPATHPQASLVLVQLALVPPLRPLQSQVRVSPQAVLLLSFATSPATQAPAVALSHTPFSGTTGAHGPLGVANVPSVHSAVALPV
jgi:hypothetical protein